MGKPLRNLLTEGMGARIKQRRDELGLTQDQLGEKLGVSRAAIAQWENEQTTPVRKRMEALADTLGVTKVWLTYGEGEVMTGDPSAFMSEQRDIPVLTPESAKKLAKGERFDPRKPDPNYDIAFRHASLKPSTEVGQFAFGMEIVGRSMEPMFIEGDMVIIDPDIEPEPGDFVFAVLDTADHQVAFARYRPRGKDTDGTPIYELAPVNPDFPTFTIDAAHKGRIIGTMTEHRRFRKKR